MVSGRSAACRRSVLLAAAKAAAAPSRVGYPSAGIFRMNNTKKGWSDGPNGGVADTLDEVKAAFRAAWDDTESSQAVTPC